MALTLETFTLARRQGGCVTRDQLMGSGVGRRTIDRMLADGRLERATHDLYRLTPSTGWLDDLRSALVALPGAVASFNSAAWLLEIPRIKPGATVTVHTRTTHSFLGVTIRRAHDLAPSHLVEIDGIRCTSTPRTIVDLAAVLHWRHVESIVQDLLIVKRLDLDAIQTVVGDIARKGKPGIASIRRVLERVGGGSYPMSELEKRGWNVLVGGGLGDGIREHGIPWDDGRRFDVAWPGAAVAVEWDSRRWHGAFEQMEFDRRRDRSAAMHGWVVLRYTWDDVTLRPRSIVHEVRRLLIARDPTR